MDDQFRLMEFDSSPHPLLEQFDGVFRVQTTSRVNNEWTGAVAAVSHPSLNRFHQTDIFFDRRLPIMFGEFSNRQGVLAIDRVPAPMNFNMPGIDLSPAISVQDIAGKHLKGKHRPEKP